VAHVTRKRVEFPAPICPTDQLLMQCDAVDGDEDSYIRLSAIWTMSAMCQKDALNVDRRVCVGMLRCRSSKLRPIQNAGELCRLEIGSAND
jgi:hypothetical protein